jgi:hypothetical protein
MGCGDSSAPIRPRADAGLEDASLDGSSLDGGSDIDGGGSDIDGGGSDIDGGGSDIDGGSIADGGSSVDGGSVADGGSSVDGGSVADGGSSVDGGTTADAGGLCAGVDCSSLSDSCNVGVCDPTDGTCNTTPRTDGTSCSDGNACTTTDVCTAGTCGGATVDCSGLTNACNVGSCNAATGACVATPVANGTSCSDGSACTTSDVCTAGTCGGTAVSCAGLTNACNVGSCNPATGACVATPVANGTSCSDGSACTTADVCTAGTCGGTAVSCAGLTNACNVGSCNPATGACVATPVANGTSCSDGSACTTGDVCTAGTCGGTAVSCGGLTNACNVGSCNPATGACVATPVANGTSCNDGSACTTTDVCTAGTCGGTAVSCAGLTNACNVGSCNPATGACIATPVANGTVCSDGNACTTTDVCTAGTCGGTAVSCAGLTNACNVGSCNPATGACIATPVANGTVCSDGLSCTAGDVCTTGVCGGTAGGVRFDFESAVTHEWTMTGGTTGWIIDASGRTGAGFSNADIIDSQNARAQFDVVYAAAGTVSFWRRTSTESSFDVLAFFIDGVQQASWSGVNAFARFQYPVAAGAHTLEWRYTKDSSVSSGTDTVTIDDVDLVGGVTRATFERGIPASFVMSGTAGWVTSTIAATGTGAMQSGTITDGQSSIATTTVRVPVPGTVSFARQVSSETGFDFLRFLVDGVSVGTWSGTVAYSRVSYPLTAGTHTLQWQYTKDGSLSSGSDKVYVDDIDITLDACPAVAFPTATATVCSGASCTTLGATASPYYYQTGDYLEQTVTFAGVSSLPALALAFTMNDQTAGCAVGATHSFAVTVNGTAVGTFSFVTPVVAPAGTISLSPSYSFAPIAGVGAGSNDYTIRMRATSTVCSGGSSWTWLNGGTARAR